MFYLPQGGVRITRPTQTHNIIFITHIPCLKGEVIILQGGVRIGGGGGGGDTLPTPTCRKKSSCTHLLSHPIQNSCHLKVGHYASAVAHLLQGRGQNCRGCPSHPPSTNTKKRHEVGSKWGETPNHHAPPFSHTHMPYSPAKESRCMESGVYQPGRFLLSELLQHASQEGWVDSKRGVVIVKSMNCTSTQALCTYEPNAGVAYRTVVASFPHSSSTRKR
jgi:hypothetical protein